MQLNDITKKNSKQEYEILSDKDKKGEERPWRDKKMNTLELAASYERLGEKKAFRVSECGTFLEFRRYQEDGSLRLNRASFCKVRLCPMCSWRRSLKVYGQISKVMDKAIEEREYRFLFLTLTIQNCEGEELPIILDKLFYAYKKLALKAKFKKPVKGWFRALEVSHNLSEDTYHPHFHVILMVNKSYFKDQKQYISQAKWTEMWKECLEVDYNPIVDIRSFKTGDKASTSKSVAEAGKYTVKDNDYLIKNEDGTVNEELTDSAVRVLDYSLANRRLVAFGGEMKKIHKNLNLDDTENGDLVNTDNEEIREDLNYVIEKYRWNIGYSQYSKF